MARRSLHISRRDFLRLSGAGLGGATLLGVAGCGGGETIQGGWGCRVGVAATSSSSGGGQIRYHWIPSNRHDTESSKVCRQIFDGLLDFAPESTDVIPALATEVPKPEDGGRSYTFKLRDGVKFHDGAEFNADAVVFNFERWRFTDNPYHKGGGEPDDEFCLLLGQFGGFDDDSVIDEGRGSGRVHRALHPQGAPGTVPQEHRHEHLRIASPKAIKENVEGFWQEPSGDRSVQVRRVEQGLPDQAGEERRLVGLARCPKPRAAAARFRTGHHPLHPGQHLQGGGPHRRASSPRPTASPPTTFPTVKQARASR